MLSVHYIDLQSVPIHNMQCKMIFTELLNLLCTNVKFETMFALLIYEYFLIDFWAFLKTFFKGIFTLESHAQTLSENNYLS